MTTKTKDRAASAKERRTGSQAMLEKLTAERTEMLTLYCRVAGLQPYNSERDRADLPQLLQEFCQVLVDYIAAGHFGLYQRIISGEERRQEVAEIAEAVYPQIARATEVALEFNDKYDREEHCKVGDELDRDLSRLGEALATRIELEDRLLDALC